MGVVGVSWIEGGVGVGVTCLSLVGSRGSLDRRESGSGHWWGQIVVASGESVLSGSRDGASVVGERGGE